MPNPQISLKKRMKRLENVATTRLFPFGIRNGLRGFRQDRIPLSQENAPPALPGHGFDFGRRGRIRSRQGYADSCCATIRSAASRQPRLSPQPAVRFQRTAVVEPTVQGFAKAHPFSLKTVHWTVLTALRAVARTLRVMSEEHQTDTG